MKKINIKLIIIIFVCLFLLLMNTIVVQAEPTTFDTAISGAKSFVSSSGTEVNGTSIKNLSMDLFNVFFTIGVIIAVIITSIIGIKFLLSSPEGKAEIKETLMPYAIGCVVIFGAYGIWKIALTILQPLN